MLLDEESDSEEESGESDDESDEEEVMTLTATAIADSSQPPKDHKRARRAHTTGLGVYASRPPWVRKKRAKVVARGTGVRGNGSMFTEAEDAQILAAVAEGRLAGTVRGGLIRRQCYEELARHMPGRTACSLRRRHRRLQLAAAKEADAADDTDEEEAAVEVLGPVASAERTDTKLWDGAYADGWRVHEYREQRYVYAHAQLAPEGSRLPTREAVFEARAMHTAYTELEATGEPASALQGNNPTELEGYMLVPSYRKTSNTTGYHCVSKVGGCKNAHLSRPFNCVIETDPALGSAQDGKGRCMQRGKRTALHLGTFRTAAEAALAYAKHVGKAAAAREAAVAREIIERRATALTVEEAEAIAHAEGLTLHRDPNSPTGFKAVSIHPRCVHLPYFVKVTHKGYRTAGAAALAYARHRKCAPDRRLTAGGKWQSRSLGVGHNIAVLPQHDASLEDGE